MAPVLRHCPCLRPENDDVRLLDYSHSNLDDVPNEVFGFERTLEELFLDANQIKDLPRPLFHCHGLRKLNLSDNEIQTLPPAVASLINLEQLDISKNGVLEIPDNIKGCKCLTVIDASVNPLGKLPEGFTYLINLQELYLNDTFLEYLPANFGRLSRLKILELRENHLKLLPKSMARLTELSRLDIGQNDFSDLPEVIGNLPRLVELWCDNNNLNCLPPFLGGLKKLAYLDASKNEIYEVADEIEGCISLCDLTLSSNRIKVLPDGIANLRKLSVLRVDENRITSVPENIGNLCNLEELVLSSNNLKSLPPSLGLLRNLRTLIADDNLLEELPCEVGSCLKLTILSLRDNKLVQIPDELGHITALKVINLSGNLLQYLPFTIAKLPNLQALWLSENQNKPLIPLQSDTDRATGQKVLTCFMLPQVPLDEEVIEVEEVEVSDSVKGRQIIKFAFDAEKDQPSKLVRAPTPYPKELKAHARHARNYALKKQGSKESDANEVPNDISQVPIKAEGLHATGATPDIMILPSGPPPDSNSKVVKEAVVTKPKSPLASPPRHERHYIHSVKDPVSHEMVELKQHAFLEQNPLQLSHQAGSEVPGPDISAKILGRRDSRGDGSSSENTSTSATGSPKSTPDVALADSYNHPQKVDKEGHFRKNIPSTTGKRDTWMRQRLLRQGSGDSDRGYRSDHEVYLAEKDQYGQCYHDGYASDWEAFLAKQNYSAPQNVEPMPNPQYMRPMPHGDMGYRGHAEGQEIKDGENAYPYQWDPRFRYPDDGTVVDDEYQARMTPPYDGYWQMDMNSGHIYGAYDMSHSYPPGTDNPAYIYTRNQRGDVAPPMATQPYYDDDGYKHPSSNFWMQRMPNPGSVVVNNPGTLPRRLSAASPRMKRAQCLSVQAPLHGSPQEYHLMPHQAANLRPPIPNSSPRPGRSPSPGIDNRVQYSPQPYPKFAPHYQPQYSAQGYPITTQPMNSVHFPPPMPNVHPSYHGNFQESPPVYPTMPPSPRMKQTSQPYAMSTVDDSALLTRPYSHVVPQPAVHTSGYYNPENIPPGQHIDSYSHGLQNPVNPDTFTKVQDAEYGMMQTATLQYRSGSIPAHIQNLENCDMNDIQHLNRSVPSINIIPSTSPPHTAYMAATAEGWRDKSRQGEGAVGNPEPKAGSSASQNISQADNSRTNNVTSNRPDVGHLKENNNNNNNNINNNSVVEENKSIPDSSQTIKNTDAHSHISAQDSFVVVSPKPSKIINPHMIANSSPVNKDPIGPTILSENQTAFRKPGCFQAVPVTIPSVHASVRKKEVAENEQKVQYTNVNECKNQNSSVKNQPNDQKNESSLGMKGFRTPAESNKQSGIVGDIVNQINSSVKTDKNIAQYDHKTVASSVQQSITVQNSKSEFKKIDIGPPMTKPGFPVKIVNSQQPDSSQLPKDIPPDLPKKEKNLKSLQNTTFASDSNKSISTINASQNPNHDIKKLPTEKLSKAVPTTINRDHGKHSSTGLSEHPRALQNKIAIENSKNTKKDNCEGYSLNANTKQLNANTKQHKSEMTKKDAHENSKQCSSDKRFQKVLPPIDKTFSLKPCSARKSVNLSDAAEHTSEIPKVPEHQKSDKTVDSIPPSIPPKVNMQQTNMHYIDKNYNDPPMIPPKKSANATKILQAPKENISNKDNAAKFPSENFTQRKPLNANEQRASKNEEIVSKLNVDIVEVKDANNEKNVQLQKGNMPDLISKIIPNEKTDLILIEDGKIDRNVKTEKDDLGNNKSYITNKEKSMQEKDAPESPKSPKRQSWFFGTHKNSLVFPVIILKNPELGFSIEGGIGSPRNPAKPNDNGIYVAHVLADGPACNSLRPGDKILQVDGTDFTQLDHNKALAVLQESGSTVSLMISRE